MNTLRAFWAESPAEYKDYLFIYLWGVLWAATYLFLTPAITLYTLSIFLIALWTLVTAAGGVIAFIGLVKRDNLLLERLGVNMLIVGPIAYALTQLGLIFYTGMVGDPSGGQPFDRIHLLVFSMWPILFLNKRRRQLKIRVDVAKKVPLRGEEIEG